MNLVNTVKKYTAIVGISVVAAYGIATIVNNISMNEKGTFDHNNGLSGSYIKKANWTLGSTELIRYEIDNVPRLDYVAKRNLNNTIEYSDGGRHGPFDGKVDGITITNRYSDNVYLNRVEDYDEFMDKFDNADKFLAKTKERFKDDFYDLKQ